MRTTSLTADTVAGDLEAYRHELTGYCYRMLGSPFEAEDAVQDTMLRAWRGRESFAGSSTLRSWLYRIATNVCFDMLTGRARRARPMDLGPSAAPVLANLATRPDDSWVEPVPMSLVAVDADPADIVASRESVRLAFVAALQHLPPRQRAVLILCEVLRWQAREAAELLDTTTASVNSALQRARATLDAHPADAARGADRLGEEEQGLLARYVDAFERYDMTALVELIHEDATQSMPPYEMWLAGRDDILGWWVGPGIECKGSRVIPVEAANGSPAFGQYKRDPAGGYAPWALQVLEIAGGRIVDFTFFLDTARIFPLFGLPPHLDA